ncbi:hypothetical protein K502DRAFT_315692 [Neoconidiobolus thromboides FSU 785]|nr:hypothetical protein K502DRAFT_315692 [Neoconidiobolus thromboides FSU 785]
MTLKQLSLEEISKHNSATDCWCIIYDKVYDLTQFLGEHPGGKNIILKYAGKDATKAFDPIHPKDIIQRLLPPEVEMGTYGSNNASTTHPSNKYEEPHHYDTVVVKKRPNISTMLNLYDFEVVAKHLMKREAWAYYSSGADDELTLRENITAFQRIYLKPRVMINVKKVTTNTKILSNPSQLPIYITATALGKLGHPKGEVNLTKAAYSKGIIQMIPTLSSCSLDDIVTAKQKEQVQFLQLYVNSQRSITERVIKNAEAAGCKGLFITVDAPQLGKREKDMRMKFEQQSAIQNAYQHEKEKQNRNQGAARAISSFIDPSLCWEDLKWFKKVTNMPIVLKGIQAGEDAVLAAQHGVQGVVLSNHGGRQIDTARSGIEILPEVMEMLDQYYQQNPTQKRMEVYIDGGIRRGSDIFKALALGATAVGIGRPFLYAMSTYGQEGIEKAIDILREELEMTMRLMGTPTLKDITKNHLIPNSITNHTNSTSSYWSSNVYEPLSSPTITKL